MDIRIAQSASPFRWQGNDYTIVSCGLKDDQPYAEVTPSNEKLVEELKKRIARDKALNVYLAFGYTCFPEDYSGT